MLENGYIKIHRSLLDWEWYGDVNTTRLFLHLLLTVNHYDNKWRGKIIKRGQRAVSLIELSEETKLTERQIRTSISRLISTGEIAKQKLPECALYSVLNYEKYQCDDSDISTDKKMDIKNDIQTTQEVSAKRQSKKVCETAPQAELQAGNCAQRQTNDTTCVGEMTLKRRISKNNIDIINNLYNNYKLYYDYTKNEILIQALIDFEIMRKEIKKPLTDRAKKMILDSLNKMEISDDIKIKVLEQSILHNWQGVFPLKVETKEQNKNNPIKTDESEKFKNNGW